MTLLNTLLETCVTLTKQVDNLEQDKIAQAIEITKLKQRVRRRMHPNRGKIVELDANEDVTLEAVDAEVAMDADVHGRLAESQAKVYHLDLEHAEKVLSMQDTDEAEPAEVEEVIEVVTAAKLMTEVVTTTATTITAAQVPKASAPKRIRDQVKRKEKQDNTVMRYQTLKRKPITEAHTRKNMMVYLKNMAGFKMDFFRGMTYNDIRPIFEKHYNSIQAFLKKEEEEITEQEKGSKRKDDSPEQRAAKKQRIDEEEEELKKTFTDYDFLLNTFKAMFEKPNVEANIWREQKGRYGLAKVKSWKLFKSCGLHIITFTTTQMFLLVEKKYHLTRFTLEQMLNNGRLKVEEESEMSLELLKLMRRQLQDGYIPDGLHRQRPIKENEYGKGLATIEELAQYEEEGWNDPIFLEEGSLNYKSASIEQLLGVMECQVDMLMKDTISLMGKSGDLFLPPFEVYTPLVTCPKEVEETIEISMEVEPIDHIKQEDLGLNTCSHDIFLSSREIPSVDESKPQLLPNFSPLDVYIRDKRGTDPPIKPHSLDSFRMKVVDKSTISTPPSPHVASFHPKDMYCYYHPCIDDPKKHYGFKQETKKNTFKVRGDGVGIKPDGVESPTLIRNLVAPPPNNTYVPFGASPRMCPGIELVKMETSAMIHFLPGIIIVALMLVNESVNAKNPINPLDFSINSSIGNATSNASLSPPNKEENRCMD
nr:cytochrome P450 716B1-like [Tanacetum cinerariifolium]